jgi:hypothetical protein
MNLSWLCTLKLHPCGIHDAMWVPPSASKLVNIAWSFTGNFCSAILMASLSTFEAMARSSGGPSKISSETMDDLCPPNQRFAITEERDNQRGRGGANVKIGPKVHDRTRSLPELFAEIRINSSPNVN